jgi:predicted RNase H-like HicB family nuclease
MKDKNMPSDVIVLEREFPVVIEEDDDGIFVASVEGLKGCHVQAKTLDEVRNRMKKAVHFYLANTEDRIKLMLQYKDG